MKLARAPRWLLALAAYCLMALPLAATAAEDAGGAAGDQIIVTLRERQAPAAGDADGIARDFGMRLVEQRRLASLEADCAVFAVPGGADRDTLVARLNADARVERAQPVYVHRVAGAPPNDPYFDLQQRTRPAGIMPLLARGSGRNVRIAIIDTGVDVNHPDLLGQLVEWRNFVGVDDRVMPPEFHGTAVTGLIAAHAGNGIGIHGLASDAAVYVLRACWEPVYGYGRCSSFTLAQALDYAIEVRARIINLSLAGPDDPLLVSLVERAVELGAIVFGAIGEEPDQDFPASVPAVIAVEQSHQSEAEVAGPRLTVPGLQLLTTVPGGRYDFVSGPSFATAHASGVAAVMLELEPHLDGPQLAARLRRLHHNLE